MLLSAQPESFCSGLQKIAVAGGALRVQLEILHPAVVQDDDLDILSAHVDDDVRILIKLQRRLSVSHGLHERDIRVQLVLQNIFGVAGGGDSQDLEFGILRFNLPAQIFEHLDCVLDGVTV